MDIKIVDRPRYKTFKVEDLNNDKHAYELIFADRKCKPYFDFEIEDGDEKDLPNISEKNIACIKKYFPDGDIVVLESHGIKENKFRISFHYIVNKYSCYPPQIKFLLKQILKEDTIKFDDNPYAVNDGKAKQMRCINQSKGYGDNRVLKLITDHTLEESLITNPTVEAIDFQYSIPEKALPKEKKQKDDKVEKKVQCIDIRCYMEMIDFANICDALPDNVFVDKDLWKDFTKFCKVVAATSDIDEDDVKKVWNKKSQEGQDYDIANNEKIYDFYELNCCYGGVFQMLGLAKNNFAYWFAKKVDDIIPLPDHCYDEKRKFVSMERSNVLKTWFKKKRGLVVKADMAMGKTHAFIKHIKEAGNPPFIVLTSRVSLGKDIYERLCSADVDCSWYKDVDGAMADGGSMVCQIESFAKLVRIRDWSKYVVMIDEADSFIEHIHTSPTCSNNRRDMFEQIRRILGAAYVYCCDADISSRSFKFLHHIMGKENVSFVQYDRKFFSGRVAKEHFNEASFIKELNTNDKYILFVDSKSKGAVLRQELLEVRNKIDPDEETNITIIDSDFNGDIDLNKYDKVICSPTIIYGIDSQVERPVFCFYRSHTISPKAMVQQVGRERQITKLHYLFVKKSYTDPVYKEVESVRKVIENRWSLNKGELPKDIDTWVYEREDAENFYYTMLSEYLYLDSCYDTNKFLHFRDILKRKGFVLEDDKCYQTTVNSKTRDKLLKKMDRDEKMDRLKEFVAIKESKAKKSMNIPEDRLEEFADIYLEPFDMTYHFNYCSLKGSTRDDCQFKYDLQNDFDGMKAVGNKARLLYLKELSDVLGCDEQFNFSNSFSSVEQRKEYYDNFLKKFNRDRNIYGTSKDKPYESDWSNMYCVSRDIGRMLKDLVGDKNIKSERKGGKKNRKYEHAFINEKYHNDLRMFYMMGNKRESMFDDDSDGE